MYFSSETIEYLKKTDLTKRKKLGQYFTNKIIREDLISHLPKIPNADILEPSAGTGEFIETIIKSFDNPNIDATEIDQELCNIVKNKFNKINVVCADALSLSYKKYDYIIGNPPYFKIDAKLVDKNEYGKIINGRINIFGLFIKHHIDLLKDGGYLAFVVPCVINNGLYFDKLRKYIINNTNIEYIKTFDEHNFEDALQKVMIIILKKTSNKGNYIFKNIFSPEFEWLEKQFVNKKTLKELGFKAKTGSVVWNQNKDLLSNNPADTLLIWAHNLKEKNFSSQKKPQYIKTMKNIINKKSVVVNRIIGSGDNIKINAMIIDPPFLGENHTNIIQGDESQYGKIVEVLTSMETKEILKNIIGSTQLSKKELENFIPIG